MELLENFLFQILFSVGIVAAFGLVIALCRRAFCRLTGRLARPLLLATGVIGTPVHEIGHAAMCVLFGHRITAIKLYQIDDASGTLGYVRHSYNPKNLYCQVGNFFIGVGPILLGSGVILLAMFLLVPDVFAPVTDSLSYLFFLDMDFFAASTYAALFEVLADVWGELFDFTNLGNALWWLFMVLAVAIALHMEISPADIRGGAKGFLFLAGLLLAADVVLYFVNVSALDSLTQGILAGSFYIVGFLSVSAVMSAVVLILALAVKGVTKIAKR